MARTTAKLLVAAAAAATAACAGADVMLWTTRMPAGAEDVRFSWDSPNLYAKPSDAGAVSPCTFREFASNAPEPSSATMLLIGAAILGLRRRRTVR
ncbi:MAG: PEP-CTERM sorting domain-containing protein [Kiritimatiellae bacterium]|nr:PEP-CTERM sorting domain-containing protein [Kiritimatiellia bacterium]